MKKIIGLIVVIFMIAVGVAFLTHTRYKSTCSLISVRLAMMDGKAV